MGYSPRIGQAFIDTDFFKSDFNFASITGATNISPALPVSPFSIPPGA